MGDLADLAMYEETLNQAVLAEAIEALSSAGVRGYVGDDLLLDLPDARDHQPPQLQLGCKCRGAETCHLCCWAFPLGIWMVDGHAPLHHAAAAAETAAREPWVSAILVLASSFCQHLPAMAEKVAARLLDVAILTGNDQAAASLAQTYPARPLRRWKGNELEDKPGALSAALLAGADFQRLHVTAGWEVEEIPLLRYFALQESIQGVLPQQLAESWPSHNMLVGDLFLTENGRFHSLSMQKLQNAKKGGWALKRIFTYLFDLEGSHQRASLLDLAILCGQPDCAEALADAGVELDPSCSALHNGDVPGQLQAGGLLLHVASPSQGRSAEHAAGLRTEIPKIVEMNPWEVAASSAAGS